MDKSLWVGGVAVVACLAIVAGAAVAAVAVTRSGGSEAPKALATPTKVIAVTREPLWKYEAAEICGLAIERCNLCTGHCTATPTTPGKWHVQCFHWAYSFREATGIFAPLDAVARICRPPSELHGSPP